MSFVRLERLCSPIVRGDTDNIPSGECLAKVLRMDNQIDDVGAGGLLDRVKLLLVAG
jgi:hypothetical protein